MDISVVICTFNRAASLGATLGSYVEMERPADVASELIVVDNNSSDGTRATVETYRERYPAVVRYVHEKTAGLSHARNAGIAAAHGAVVAFADDDVDFDRRWLTEVVRTFREVPDAMALGGRSIPRFAGGRPVWLTDAMMGFYGSTNSGDVLKTMTFPECPFGLNMAFRRGVFDRVGGFSTDLGRLGSSLLSNEESEMFRRLDLHGLRVVYTPDAVVHHRIAQERTSKGWMIRREFWQGVSEVVSNQLHQPQPRSRLLGSVWKQMRWMVVFLTGRQLLPHRMYRCVRSRSFADWGYFARTIGKIRQDLREALAWRR